MASLEQSLNMLDMYSASPDVTAVTLQTDEQIKKDIPYYKKFHDIIGKAGVSQDYTPTTYKTLMEMWEMAGKPAFQTLEEEEEGLNLFGKLFRTKRAHYELGDFSRVRNILKGKTTKDTRPMITGAVNKHGLSTVIEELAHGYQFGPDVPLPTKVYKGLKTGVEGALGALAGIIPGVHQPQYEMRGTEEYEAHSEISPVMHKEYLEATFKDLEDIIKEEHGLESWDPRESRSTDPRQNLLEVKARRDWLRRRVKMDDEMYKDLK